MAMDKQTAEALVAKHGGVVAAARAIGVQHAAISRAIRGRTDVGVAKPSTDESAKKAGRSLSEFRQTYDKATIIPARIRDGLKALGSGWEYEADFCKLAGVSAGDLSRFRDQFAAHVVTIGRDSRRAWAGTEKTAQEMRDML